MAIQQAVDLDEYLRTDFNEPECEFVDGEVVQKAVPDLWHGQTPLQLGVFFFQLKQLGLAFLAAGDTGIRVSPTRVRRPDVAMFERLPESVKPVDTAPLIAIEILSEDDRM